MPNTTAIERRRHRLAGRGWDATPAPSTRPAAAWRDTSTDLAAAGDTESTGSSSLGVPAMCSLTPRAAVTRAAVSLGLTLATLATAHPSQLESHAMSTPASSAPASSSPSSPAARPAPSDTLSARQQAIVPIGAFAAAGDIPRLNEALNQGMDAGLTISDAKEILVQVYAYAGFPRSLNALGELMKVVDARQKRGITDAPGNSPSAPIPTGDALLAAGTANQTSLVGQPVKGPLFDFAPAIDQYLKTHLFGDIFARDNLDWQSRELATVGMLSALQGAESQLQSHLAISMNMGITAAQLKQLAGVLQDRVGDEPARRTREALHKQQAKGK